MSLFKLPDLGEGLKEAEIVAWHVSAGDHVTADQPLVSVETDKAVVEIPAPHSGTIVALKGAPGDIVAVGAPLVEIGTDRAADKGAIVGEVATAPRSAPPAAPKPKPKQEEAPAKRPPSGKSAPAHREPVEEPQTRARAAPAVRARARELGVALETVEGSGPDGAILSGDLPAAATSETGGKPLRGVRRAMAEAMAKAGAEVVPATLTDRADIHGWPPGTVPMARLIRAVAAACKSEPALNAAFREGRLFVNESIDISIAVDTPEGLFAPVLREADTPGAMQRLEALKTATAERRLSPEDLRGGTITLSNFGMMGGEHAALVVSPPQVAILGAGRIHDAVLAADGAPAIRRVLPLSLSFDHRVVTGGEAARFMAAVIADLERPGAA